MFQKIVTALLFTSLALTASEFKEFPFIGVTVATQTLDISPRKTENTVALRWGKQSQEWRTMFTYEYNNHFETLSAEIDRIYADGVFGMPQYRPYVGFSLGTVSDNSLNQKDTSGIYYGLNAGMLFYVSDKIDADLSYHYYKVKEFENVTALKGATLGFHYFY